MAKKPDKATKPADKKGKGKKDKPAAPRKTTTKPPKSSKKKGKEPLNREERQKAAWLRKTERRAAVQAVQDVVAKTEGGLSFAQLKASGLTGHQPQPAGPTFEQTLLEVVAEQAREFESAKPVSLPEDTLEPEIRIVLDKETFGNTAIEYIVEPVGDTATRKVVEAQIRSLLEKTEVIFRAYHRFFFCGAAILFARRAVEGLFEKEPEDSPLRLRLAEVVIADDQATAISNFLEEVLDRVTELQLVAGSLDSESELEKSVQLGLIDEVTAARLQRAAAEEAVRLDLAQRLSGLMTVSTGTPVEVDETFAILIAESAQAAKVQRRERAIFRKTLSQRLQRRNEQEGRRFSRLSEESDDEGFALFLASHRGKPGVKQAVEQALLALRIETEIAAADKRWADLKSRLAAGANDPETAVAQNAAAMKDLLGNLAQIRALPRPA